jgi:hypothetical protein
METEMQSPYDDGINAAQRLAESGRKYCMRPLTEFRKIAIAKLKPELLAMSAFALLFFALENPVLLNAEDPAGTVRSSDSYAELFVGSAKNPYSYSPGVARVSGKMMLSAEDPTKTVLDLKIYPADRAARLDVDGPNYSELEFKSERSWVMPGGELGVSGDLILHQVERPEVEEAEQHVEDFSGPDFGDAVVREYRSKVMFIFPKVKSATARQASTNFSGASVIGYENIPQLLPALLRTKWPVVVQNEQCAPFGNIEDYSGQQCTGKVISAPSQYASPGWPGEEFSGPKPLLAGNQVTIKLRLVVGGGANSQELGGEGASVQVLAKK